MVLGTADVVLPTWVLVISIIGPVLISTLAFIGTTWLGLADFRRKVRADATEAEITLLRSFASWHQSRTLGKELFSLRKWRESLLKVGAVLRVTWTCGRLSPKAL